ncbi:MULTISPECIES: hypothetical protein [unclassified Paenibacillus]
MIAELLCNNQRGQSNVQLRCSLVDGSGRAAADIIARAAVSCSTIAGT